MWSQTRAAAALGVAYPIVQGPFGGGLSSTDLTAIVSNAGGLGSFGADALSGAEIRDLVAELRLMTPRPFAVNLWIPKGAGALPSAADLQAGLDRLETYRKELGLERPALPARFGRDYREQVRSVLDARPPVFSFVYGVPEPAILQACRERGIVTLGTATTPDEAVLLDRAGVDCIVASSFEAGGHKGAFLKPAEPSLTGAFALIPQVVDRVKAPVIAAGGVADGRGVKAALALGAGGVQIGTAFLACRESGASPAYRALLFSKAREDTVLTPVFTGRLARSIRNRFADEMQPHAAALADYPIQSWFAGALKPAAIAKGRTDLIALWAGQAAPLVRFKSAQALFDHLIGEMSAKAA